MQIPESATIPCSPHMHLPREASPQPQPPSTHKPQDSVGLWSQGYVAYILRATLLLLPHPYSYSGNAELSLPNSRES